MTGRIWHIALALAGATWLAAPSAAETEPSPALVENQVAAAAQPTLRPHVAALITSAQDKLRASDVLGAITDLDHAMTQRPTPSELGVTLAVRGGALYTQGDLRGALADWRRALTDGALDEATQLHLVHNIEQLQDAMVGR